VCVKISSIEVINTVKLSSIFKLSDLVIFFSSGYK
jgi:hypothetical protein